MKKVRRLEKVKITGISADGRSVGRKDKMVVFIKGGAPGDVVDVHITGKEKKFLVGRPDHFHTRSGDRVEPFCDHFGTCGGCKWQHLDYDAQLRFKQQHVEENLRKISGMELPVFAPILGSKETTHYRNKLEYTFSNNRWLTHEEIKSSAKFSRNGLGFHIPGMFDKILDIQECHLQAAPSNAIRLAVKDYAERNDLEFYNVREHQGFLRNLIIRTTSIGQLMVIVQFARNDRDDIWKLLNFIKDEFPEITSLMYVINEKKNDTFYDLPVKSHFGEDFIVEKLGDLSFRIGPKSFFQTNSSQAHELYKKVEEFAELTGEEVVYDLYTGTGTIANFIAHKAKKVVGVESVEEAVEDAKKNAAINGIHNTSFHTGDMKDMLSDEFFKRYGRPKVVICDPPRAGMHKKVLRALVKTKPQRIVYVSCNPATQARDMQELADTYQVRRIQPVDMFPHTHHVENVVLLELKS
jgi:23S rRNA (uracil1939-C5)-methyltransferase